MIYLKGLVQFIIFLIALGAAGLVVYSFVNWMHSLLNELKRIRELLEQRAGMDGSPAQGIDFTTLLVGACEDRMTDLQQFTASGEASDDALSHIDVCKDCQDAVERVMTRQAKGLEELARHLKKNDDA